MSAHAYSAANRRHARHYIRDTSQQQTFTRKKADVVVLIPRQQTLGQQAPDKSNKGIVCLMLLFVSAAHFAFTWQLTHQPEQTITKAEIPPMTVEFYRPLVEQPPQAQEEQPQPKQQPPKPVVEKPKPVAKKPSPKPVELKKEEVKKSEPIQPIATPIQPTVAPPPVQPTLTKATADAGYLRNPAPRYPDFAQQQGWEGTVILNVHVLANGKPNAVEVKQSSGRKILDDSAVQAVKRWKFVPAKLGDTEADSWVEVPIDFHLAQ